MNQDFYKSLDLPLIAAPMFLISGPELVIECCKNGIVGTFPSNNFDMLWFYHRFAHRYRYYPEHPVLQRMAHVDFFQVYNLRIFFHGR